MIVKKKVIIYRHVYHRPYSSVFGVVYNQQLATLWALENPHENQWATACIAMRKNRMENPHVNHLQKKRSQFFLLALKPHPLTVIKVISMINHKLNGPFRYLKLRYCTIFLAIFCGDIP